MGQDGTKFVVPWRLNARTRDRAGVAAAKTQGSPDIADAAAMAWRVLAESGGRASVLSIREGLCELFPNLNRDGKDAKLTATGFSKLDNDFFVDFTRCGVEVLTRSFLRLSCVPVYRSKGEAASATSPGAALRLTAPSLRDKPAETRSSKKGDVCLVIARDTSPAQPETEDGSSSSRTTCWFQLVIVLDDGGVDDQLDLLLHIGRVNDECLPSLDKLLVQRHAHIEIIHASAPPSTYRDVLGTVLDLPFTNWPDGAVQTVVPLLVVLFQATRPTEAQLDQAQKDFEKRVADTAAAAEAAAKAASKQQTAPTKAAAHATQEKDFSALKNLLGGAIRAYRSDYLLRADGKTPGFNKSSFFSDFSLATRLDAACIDQQQAWSNVAPVLSDLIHLLVADIAENEDILKACSDGRIPQHKPTHVDLRKVVTMVLASCGAALGAKAPAAINKHRNTKLQDLLTAIRAGAVNASAC